MKLSPTDKFGGVSSKLYSEQGGNFASSEKAENHLSVLD